jgi:cell division protein FtsW
MTAATLSFPRAAHRSRHLITDPILLLAVSALLLLGLTMVSSASISVASSGGGDGFLFLKKQMLGVGLGMIAIAVMCAIPTAVWQRIAFPLLIAAFVMLVVVLIPGIGHQVNGSRRWIRLGFMNFQPSELSRVLLLMYMASYIVRRQVEVKESVQGFLKPMAVLALAAGLLLLEPDFGAATVLLATGMGMLFLAGVKLRHFISLLALAVGAMALIAFASPYRVKRLLGFANPWDDPFGTGFQLVQSLIAIGRGEWYGVGLGASVQKLFYLPEAHTDFVFAVLAEELGLLGIVVMLALFGVVIVRVLQTARLAASAGMANQSIIASSYGLWLSLQAIVNIGVNMGLLPTKGLTLPFMSYGPSCMLVTLGWLGLVMRIHHEASTTGRSAIAKERGV